MSRPRKCRRVSFVPENPCFHPLLDSCSEVILNIEEVEAIRLSDYLEIDQDEAAESMCISRGTFQRLIKAARMKLSDALVHGKIIRIEGGTYELSEGKATCQRLHGQCGRQRMKCEVCEDRKSNNDEE